MELILEGILLGVGIAIGFLLVESLGWWLIGIPIIIITIYYFIKLFIRAWKELGPLCAIGLFSVIILGIISWVADLFGYFN